MFINFIKKNDLYEKYAERLLTSIFHTKEDNPFLKHILFNIFKAKVSNDFSIRISLKCVKKE
jgi:hypothetical protein